MVLHGTFSTPPFQVNVNKRVTKTSQHVYGIVLCVRFNQTEANSRHFIFKCLLRSLGLPGFICHWRDLHCCYQRALVFLLQQYYVLTNCLQKSRGFKSTVLSKTTLECCLAKAFLGRTVTFTPFTSGG